MVRLPKALKWLIAVGLIAALVATPFFTGHVHWLFDRVLAPVDDTAIADINEEGLGGPSRVRMGNRSTPDELVAHGSVRSDGTFELKRIVSWDAAPLSLRMKVGQLTRSWRLDSSWRTPPNRDLAVLVSAYGQERLPARHVPFPDGDPSSLLIRMRRTFCEGQCPMFDLTISGDGEVRYWGGGNVAVAGPQERKISAAEVEQLIEAVRRSDYFSLDDYPTGVIDAPIVCMDISYGGRRKVFEDNLAIHAGLPEAVIELQAAIENLSGADRWIGKRGRNQAPLDDTAWRNVVGDNCETFFAGGRPASDPPPT